MMSLLAVMCLHAQAAMTMEQSAIRLDRLLERIGGQTGQTLECVPDLADDRLVVRCLDAEAEELLSRIAIAVEGRWTNTENGRKLIVDTAAQQARHERNQHERVAWMREALGKITLTEQFDAGTVIEFYKQIDAAVADQSGVSPTQLLGDLRYESPSIRFAVRMANLIGVDVIGAMEDGARVVYSSHPTSLQRTLPAGASDLIQKYFAERILVGNIRGDRAYQELSSHSIGDFVEELRKGEENQHSTPAVSNVVVMRDRFGVNIALQTFDADGNVLFRPRFNMSIPSFQDISREVFSPKMPALSGEFKPSEDALNWDELLNGSMFKGGQPTPRVLAILKGESEEDTLSLSVSELLLGMAREKQENLVALVPDRAQRHLWLSGKPYTYAASVRQLLIGTRSTLSESNGWLLMRPEDPVLYRKERVPRAELHRAVHAIYNQKNKQIPVEESLSFIAKAPRTLWPAYVAMFGRLAGGTGQAVSMGNGEWPIEFVSCLDSAQRRVLLREGVLEIDLEGASQASRSKLFELLNDPALLLTDRQHKWYQSRSLDNRRSPDFGFGGIADGIAREPTWTLAQPSSSPVRIRIQYRAEDAFRQAGDVPGGGTAKMTLYGIASQEAQIRLLKEAGQSAGTKHALYGLEPIAGFFVQVSFGERFEYADYSYIALQPGVHEAIGFSELSRELKERIESLTKQILEQPKKGGGGNR